MGSKVNPYSRAHLQDVGHRIEQALDAQYVRNMPNFSDMMLPFSFFGQQQNENQNQD